LIRTHDDNSKEYIAVNIEKMLKNPSDTSENRLLKKRDVLRVSSLLDFMQDKKVSASGLFRKTGDFEYFEGMRVSDLIFLADGLREEANLKKAFLVRTKADFTKEFYTINLNDVMLPQADSIQNPFLQDKDAISVSSLRALIDEMNINAVGLFRKPGTFGYVNGMTLSDLLVITEGLKLEADLLNIEISRISFFSDEYKIGDDSRVIIKTMQLGPDTKLTDDQLAFKLNPYDQVFVRMVPDFELPKNLTITGEVKYPGVYALTRKDEHLDELIKRSGGLNRFAFPEGATLYRPGLAGEYVVMKLPKALRNNKSMYNYIVREGDVINIPQVIDLIAIRGDVEFLNVVNQEQVNAPFVKGKRANYYVKDFANGFTKTSLKKKTYVLEHNGKVNRTKNFLLFKVYPKVKKGSVVYVVSKPIDEKKEKKKSEPIDWNQVISSITIKITGLATFYILLSQLK
jgi:polysaccharide biosynthesis/export protein